MAASRRPRGTRIDPVSPGYVIERETKNRLSVLAQRAGTSPSLMLEQIVDHLELNDEGLPTWWEPLSQNEELPINSA